MDNKSRAAAIALKRFNSLKPEETCGFRTEDYKLPNQDELQDEKDKDCVKQNGNDLLQKN